MQPSTDSSLTFVEALRLRAYIAEGGVARDPNNQILIDNWPADRPGEDTRWSRALWRLVDAGHAEFPNDQMACKLTEAGQVYLANNWPSYTHGQLLRKRDAPAESDKA